MTEYCLYCMNMELYNQKPRMLKELTDGNDYNINDSQSDITEELILVETYVIMLNKVPVNQDSQTKY